MVRPAYLFEHRDPLQDRVKHLEQTVDRLRWDLVSVAPDDFHSLLHSFLRCETRQDAHRWAEDVAEQIASETKPLWRAGQTDVEGGRANCPLCHAGATNLYGEQGFKLPEGLRRHLIGFGRTRECVVMSAARELARDHWNEKFRPQEQQTARDEEALKQKRLASEATYVLRPNAKPVLQDDHYGGLRWGLPRPAGKDVPGLAWAEQRLIDLGFQVVVTGNARSYIKPVSVSGKELIVYADPRIAGGIGFEVFDPNARGQKRGKALARFDIQDRWKKNLEEKVAVGVAQAAGALKR